ncbi:MAG: hypothetical protein HYI21_06870 [Sediminibacterium sp. Gen4]|jgi:hypothetical protein|uniref:hypothetical protein n=1 Tax=unclassified Sediminibacterium TaxID=2635961 RepID=UPI0015BA40C5|nr:MULTISPECIES: hypothetical protein [unclassified Sediminibacterium]MBW0161756.1 hypothetical protein [Sediminibacterium sp.]MBW0164925.1 hypothetical protein [Sediminibacterium sp.]NWK65731.1 hypothetical protein [Sediminibacterium sp. Gen4]
MILYRAISDAEKEDLGIDQKFRTQINTLEAKQFFRSEIAVREYIQLASIRQFIPPYTHTISVFIDDHCFENLTYEQQVLDGHEAISIESNHLYNFNKCVNFIEVYVI